MTKKEIGYIEHIAYMVWSRTDTGQEMLKQTDRDTFYCFKVTDRTQTKYFTLSDKSQLDEKLLLSGGFPKDAGVCLIFTINVKDKRLVL